MRGFYLSASGSRAETEGSAFVFDAEPSPAGHGRLEFVEKGDTTHATRTFFSLW